MNINSINSMSFKGYVPVIYKARNPNDNTYVTITNKSYIKKCHSFVVRNLNGTAKSNKDKGFVEFYKDHDPDYRRMPVVHSVYLDDFKGVYLITGNDTDVIREYAKPIGRTKSEALDYIGTSKSLESQLAVKKYFKRVKFFLEHRCRRLKSRDGKKLSMILYFNPLYSKKDEIKGFQFEEVEFVKDD